MFRKKPVHESEDDEYIREYAFEPELLINRDDYLKQERLNSSSSSSISAAESAARLDDATASAYSRRASSDSDHEFKSQVEVEIEAFYHVSGLSSKLCTLLVCRIVLKTLKSD